MQCLSPLTFCLQLFLPAPSGSPISPFGLSFRGIIPAFLSASSISSKILPKLFFLPKVLTTSALRCRASPEPPMYFHLQFSLFTACLVRCHFPIRSALREVDLPTRYHVSQPKIGYTKQPPTSWARKVFLQGRPQSRCLNQKDKPGQDLGGKRSS